MKPFDFNNEKYHLGHFILDCLKNNPDVIYQIDAATGNSESNASVLRQTVQLARCFRRFGFKPGDVMTIGGRNHLGIYISFYAATMNGMPISGLDSIFKYSEIKAHFQLLLPKLSFCEKEYVEDYCKVIRDLELDTKLICFDDGNYSMKSFIEEYGDVNDDEEFTPLDFDLNKTYAFIMTTSGTTSTIKLPTFTHKIVLKKILETIWFLPKKCGDITKDKQPIIHISPLHWVTSFINAVRIPYMGRTTLTTSAPLITVNHVIDMINKYKPIYAMFGPPFAKALLESKSKCDLSCFQLLGIGGSKAQKNIISDLRKRLNPDAKVAEIYGLSETLGVLLTPNTDGPVGSCGNVAFDIHKVKLVDPITGKDVTEPNVPGEMWVIPSFTEFYNNPELTASSVTEDGWYRTGDILYKDEDGYYFFVERIKMIIICRNCHIIPAELENVIRKHSGVQDVAVTSIPHEKDGEHPVACVVRKKNTHVTAKELCNMVSDELSASMHLLGGVVFMDEIPSTSSGKVAQGKLREIVLTAHREY